MYHQGQAMSDQTSILIGVIASSGTRNGGMEVVVPVGPG